MTGIDVHVGQTKRWLGVLYILNVYSCVKHSSLPFFGYGAWISGSGTTFRWLQDVLLMHM